MKFQTVSSIISPADAARFSGRYETQIVGKDGKSVSVLRSIRNASLEQLILQGNITPTKAPAPPANAMEDLCGLFETKAKVTKSPKATSSKMAAAQDVSKPANDSEPTKSTKASPKDVSKKPSEKELVNPDTKVEGILRTKTQASSPSRSGRRTRFGGNEA